MTAEINRSVTAMSGTSVRTRVCNWVVDLYRDRRGNIAPIFAIALLPMLGFVGAAVDYTRANAARSSMQAAIDSAVLMVSKDAANNPTMTAQQITDAVQRYFTSLYHNADAFGVKVDAVYTPSTSSAPATILATGSGTITTDFMKLVGFPQMNFNTSSTATWGNSRMRVAMVLDNTGSMADNGKMTALIKAAQSMVDSLSAYNKSTGDVYISLVPFAKDVNVNGVLVFLSGLAGFLIVFFAFCFVMGKVINGALVKSGGPANKWNALAGKTSKEREDLDMNTKLGRVLLACCLKAQERLLIFGCLTDEEGGQNDGDLPLLLNGLLAERRA